MLVVGFCLLLLMFRGGGGGGEVFDFFFFFFFWGGGGGGGGSYACCLKCSRVSTGSCSMGIRQILIFRVGEYFHFSFHVA